MSKSRKIEIFAVTLGLVLMGVFFALRANYEWQAATVSVPLFNLPPEVTDGAKPETLARAHAPTFIFTPSNVIVSPETAVGYDRALSKNRNFAIIAAEVENPDGLSIIYVDLKSRATRTLWYQEGSTGGTEAGYGYEEQLTLSPDESLVLFSATGTTRPELIVLDIRGGVRYGLPSLQSPFAYPRWLPDNRILLQHKGLMRAVNLKNGESVDYSAPSVMYPLISPDGLKIMGTNWHPKESALICGSDDQEFFNNTAALDLFVYRLEDGTERAKATNLLDLDYRWKDSMTIAISGRTWSPPSKITDLKKCPTVGSWDLPLR